MTCPFRNQGSSFVLIEGGKEVPKLCLGFLFLHFSSHKRSITGDALLLKWSHDVSVCKHSKNKTKLLC